MGTVRETIKYAAKMSQEEIAKEAIKHAVRALRKRHRHEEGAHAPAVIALSRPILSQGSEWKDKAENLESELQQCYKAQARLSEQLVVEVAESRAAKSSLQEKDVLISDLQNQLTQARDECTRLSTLLEEKTKALEIMISEHDDIKKQLEITIVKADNLQTENKRFIDQLLAQKMQDAERLNEVNAMYEDMLDQIKTSNIVRLARQQVDGVVRLSEEGAEFYVETTIPSICKQRIPAHRGGCAAIAFECNSTKLVSGGQDQAVKMWDTNTGSLLRTFNGCLGSVLDLSFSNDGKILIAASGSNNLYVWDVESGRVIHTLTGHVDKVCSVDITKVSSRCVVSASYDHTMKVWDLNKGYSTNTIIWPSKCNAICISTDGQTICSGHVDGNLRLWELRTGKQLHEIAAHSNAVTSLCISRSGNLLLTSGRDNVHNLFDMQTFEVCGTFREDSNKVASNWSRSCLSSDESYIAAGSADGSVHVWSVSNAKIVSTLKEHTAPVLSCTWSEREKPLATSDRTGTICIWS